MLPQHRWQIAPSNRSQAAKLAAGITLTDGEATSPLLAQVLINRGIETVEQAELFIDPETAVLPSPLTEFPDLEISLDILVDAIENKSKIAICGDYDADGMTSTALLLRALSALGADVDYAIPSRMSDGYGINKRIVEEFHAEGVKLIITVDNGISAVAAIARAVELGLQVIITDHHDLPQELPPAQAILNPKLIAESSVYRAIAGVGVAYLLALELAQRLAKPSLSDELLELFTLGTIADLAPLTGINRRLVKQGLQLLPKSQVVGIQALIEMSGTQGGTTAKSMAMKPEDIGFRLGPRINAIGRIDDPQIIINLLTTEDMGVALARAIQCEQVNKQRQDMCARIEQEAIDLIATGNYNLKQNRVLVIVHPGWHHGVIGIVASRLVERYGVPVFIGTNEDEHPLGETHAVGVGEASPKEIRSETCRQTETSARFHPHIRGSARSIPEFNVFNALEYCHDLLGKYGGHRAAGGFSMPTENLEKFQHRLSEFAHKCLEIEHLKHLVKIDAEADLAAINMSLYEQIDAIHPCGMENPDPVFWTANVRVIEQKIVGKGHLKFTVNTPEFPQGIKAIAWRFGDYFPLPRYLDIAYKLKENNWKDSRAIELEIVSVRLPVASKTYQFNYQERDYNCSMSPDKERLTIVNAQGQALVINKGHKVAELIGAQEIKSIDITKPYYFKLIKTAMQVLQIN
ncbi:single-stranded-DNA-specific exonuclease RecJ [Chamaesiphon minutus]|uniref:Single-stranded-DNA-specific exonuclease RecJ n=1 Tax=Chamaesiphon minutus (strain ATCC 27169 / PCC 6605) TaxID=1173020 RepID=K9UH89_CHAP6|nr:DHH family phosphoesterase [Chamaesiphon minutus]AFY93579.1 single-stranded DNA-specific exonuclease [Chamaesiphon minutus PCC 6605]